MKRVDPIEHAITTGYVQLTDVQWMKRQLSRFTYRPGWSMDVEPGPLDGLWRLKVRYVADDARHPGEHTVPITAHYSMAGPETYGRNEEVFARQLQDTLFEIERHESREWLRRDGEIFDDPHAERSR